MGIGVSVFLLAVGAVLEFGIHSNVPHTNLDMVGVILMIAGGIGLVVALAVTAAHRRAPVATRERIVERDATRPAGGSSN